MEYGSTEHKNMRELMLTIREMVKGYINGQEEVTTKVPLFRI